MYANWAKTPTVDTHAGNGRDSRDSRDGREGRNDTPRENQINVALILRDLAYIKERIDQICTADTKQEDRLKQIEKVTWAVSAVTGLLVLIFVPIAIAAIKKWWGLP